MKKVSILVILFFSTTAFAYHPDLKVISIDGTEYLARPNKEIKFCPNNKSSSLFMIQHARQVNCLGNLSSNPSFLEVSSCFKSILLSTYFYDELQLLGLSKKCLYGKYIECKEIIVDPLTNRKTGVLGLFLQTLEDFDITSTFTRENGIAICNKIFFR